MRKKEVLKRAGMSAEKGRELDAVFATWIVGKRAKRLGSKQKARTLQPKLVQVSRTFKIIGIATNGSTLER